MTPDNLIALIGLILTIVAAAWSLSRKLTAVELKITEVKGAVDVLDTKLVAHTEADANNFAELKEQLSNGRSKPRKRR